MNKSVKKLLSTTYGVISVVAISSASVYAQSNQGGPPDNAPPGQQPNFQRPGGGPETQENGPPEGAPGGGYRGRFAPAGQGGPGNSDQQPSGRPPQGQGQGQPGLGSGEVPPRQRRPWDGDGQGPGQGPGNSGSGGHSSWGGGGQGPGNFGPGGRGQWGGGQSMSKEEREQHRARMLKMFDKNGDGQLDENERAQMRAYMAQRREQHMQREGQSQQGAGGFNNGQPPN